MAYNTKEIVKDKDGNPISQYYNKDLDKYEPVEGSGGGNKVVLYNEDGSENNSLSLIPILDKLSQLTGTVIDEETRKSNELQRIAFFEMLQKMLADGELKGEQGIQGLIGKGLEFNWIGTELGVRIEGQADYIYVDLKGEKGETGNIENLKSTHIIEALGYTPADTNLIGLLTGLTTEQKNNLVDAINEIDNKFKRHEVDLSKYALFIKKTNQVIPTGANTLIFWENEPTHNEQDFCKIDELTGRVKILQSGIYEIICTCLFDGNTLGARYVSIKGEFITSAISIGANSQYMSTSGFTRCYTNELLEITVQQTTGNSLDLLAPSTNLWIRRISKL